MDTLAILYSDGSSSPHLKKPAGYGFLILNSDESHQIVSETGEVPTDLGRSVNIAEYYAMMRGLETAKDLGIIKILIRTDSQLIAYQVTGKYKTKDDSLVALRDRVRALLTGFEVFHIEWIRRHLNRADAVSRVENAR